MKTVKIIGLLQMWAAVALFFVAGLLGRITADQLSAAEHSLGECCALTQQHQNLYRLTAENLSLIRQSLQDLGDQLGKTAQILGKDGNTLTEIGDRWYMVIGSDTVSQSAASLKDAGIGSGAVAQAVARQAEVLQNYDVTLRPQTETVLAGFTKQLEQYHATLQKRAAFMPWTIICLLSLFAFLMGANGFALWRISKES